MARMGKIATDLYFIVFLPATCVKNMCLPVKKAFAFRDNVNIINYTDARNLYLSFDFYNLCTIPDGEIPDLKSIAGDDVKLGRRNG